LAEINQYFGLGRRHYLPASARKKFSMTERPEAWGLFLLKIALPAPTMATCASLAIHCRMSIFIRN